MRIRRLPKGNPQLVKVWLWRWLWVWVCIRMNTTTGYRFMQMLRLPQASPARSKMNISVTLIHLTFNSDIKFLTYFVLIMHANLLSRRSLNEVGYDWISNRCLQVSPLSVRFILIPAAWSPRILSPDLWTPHGLLRPQSQRALRWICLLWDLRPDKSKFCPRPLPAASCCHTRRLRRSGSN